MVVDQFGDRLAAHRWNPLRLPEASVPVEGSAHARLVAAAASGDVLFHGSNDRTIHVFEPREH